jgi:hypothetical protein
MLLSQRLRTIGRLSFFLLWIPFAGLMISMFGMPDGEYDWAELPVLARYSFIGLSFFGVTSISLMVGASITAGLSNRSVLSRGRPATATILKIWDTGTTINKNPVVRMQLEVHPPDEPVFQAETERLIPRLQIPQIQPGSVVHVKYDPQTRAVALVSEDEA